MSGRAPRAAWPQEKIPLSTYVQPVVNSELARQAPEVKAADVAALAELPQILMQAAAYSQTHSTKSWIN